MIETDAGPEGQAAAQRHRHPAVDARGIETHLGIEQMSQGTGKLQLAGQRKPSQPVDRHARGVDAQP